MIGQFVILGTLVFVSLPRLPSLVPLGLGDWLAIVSGMAGIGIGGWTLVRGFIELGPSLTPFPFPREDAALVESGVYARIRHPIYAGLIVAGFGWGIVTRSLSALAVAVVLAVFLDAKARREEGWLAERYPSYAPYRQRTNRFLPWVY